MQKAHASDCKVNGYWLNDGIVYAPEEECDCEGVKEGPREPDEPMPLERNTITGS